MRLKHLAAVLLAASTAASAHHSPVMFDTSKQITLDGTVRQFQFTNPHCYIQLVVDGTEWSLEMGAPVYLANRGWKPSTLRPGDKIRVTASQNGVELQLGPAGMTGRCRQRRSCSASGRTMSMKSAQSG